MRDSWRRVRLGDVAELDIDRVAVEPERLYRIAGVMNAGNGLFEREAIRGSETNYAVLHRLRAGQLVMRKLTAWEGPITTVGADFDGLFVSAEFPTFTLAPALLPSFMALVCQQPSFWDAMKDRSTGTVQRRKRVNPGELLRIAIDLPPREEQRRIVDLVASVSTLKDCETEAARAADTLRRALTSELLMLREGWRQVRLGEIADLRIGRTPPRDDPRYWTADLARPFCTIADMTRQSVVPTREGITEEAEQQGKAKRVPAGALLLSFKLTIGRVGFAGTDLFPNEAIAWVYPVTPEVDLRYLGIWLGSQDLQAGSGRAVKGNTLNSTSLKAIAVNLPPLVEQVRIADLLSLVQVVQSGYEDAARAAEQLRAHLVSDLLGGSRDIPASYDRFIEDAA
jgi:type I restriction enzyme, S subunit